MADMERRARAIIADIGAHGLLPQKLVEALEIGAILHKAAAREDVQELGFRRDTHLSSPKVWPPGALALLPGRARGIAAAAGKGSYDGDGG
ncbi:MAG: hypothetical protein AAFR84_09780 [Pseudomonadota bacterium]